MRDSERDITVAGGSLSKLDSGSEEPWFEPGDWALLGLSSGGAVPTA
jgi:hypothetical protein